jgi:hypothetical protein
MHAATTTDRDRKELLHTLLEEVIIRVDRDAKRAELTLRWRGGALTELTLALPRQAPPKIRTSEDTVQLVRRLAVHHPDGAIAGILNRQGRTSARGQAFTASIVSSLRTHWKIPCYPAGTEPTDADPVSVAEAARELGVVASTVHRWVNDGFIPAEQTTPARPGGSGSPMNSAPASSSMPPTATCRCSKLPICSACPGRRCCSVSSAANSTPSTSEPDAEKAYE